MKLIGMFRLVALPLGAVVFLLSSPASANLLGKDKSLYIGASVGAASTEFEEDGVDIDDSDLAYKLFGGWQFNGLFAIEGGEEARSEGGRIGQAFVVLQAGYLGVAVADGDGKLALGVAGATAQVFKQIAKGGEMVKCEMGA